MHSIKLKISKLRTDLVSEQKLKNDIVFHIKEKDIEIEKQQQKNGYTTTIQFRDIMNYSNYQQVQLTLIEQLKDYISIEKNDKILVIGLGNEKSTPDSLGPMTINKILVTSYLYELGELKDGYSNVCCFSPDVMGNTGIETSDLIKSVIKETEVSKVVVIDALRTNKLSRLGKIIQITDKGIQPGSGIGNTRKEISKNNMNVNVVAIGIPTVIEYVKDNTSMMVTPTDIDFLIEKLSILIADSLNKLFHKDYNRHTFY